ncbi:uncharacterized protein MONOS_18635 [Monocercomonoides exilis]|uniref:uncharacterized protein n=1 Tax=Monocercomonoides exilis TaxID=2049356 RepID=UPI00355A7673|nr:hypothetical protein MONOS_18635 [Monocercomonoides exilis]
MQKTLMAKESPSKKQIFLEKLSQLEDCDEDEQKQKIGEMNEIVDRMNNNELESIFNEETFNKTEKMIEKKKISLENMCLLLKYIGIYKETNRTYFQRCREYSLGKRIQKMIIEENKRKSEEKKEKLLTDLCEFYISLSCSFSPKLLSICVSTLLKVALNKEENEKARKEVEIALLALSNIKPIDKVPKELYLNEIKEIIQYQQEHQDLTRLANQCAWQFLMNRFYWDKSMEEVIVNEQHFAREAATELEELARSVDWKKKEEEMSKEEAREMLVISRWIQALSFFFENCLVWNEEYVELFSSIVQVSRAVRENQRKICDLCICLLRNAAERRVVKDEALLCEGAVDTVLEGIQRPTLNDMATYESLEFFNAILRRLKEVDDKMEETKRKALKKEIFEQMEEEGYEDTIASFHGIMVFLQEYFDDDLSLNISDYFVNV